MTGGLRIPGQPIGSYVRLPLPPLALFSFRFFLLLS